MGGHLSMLSEAGRGTTMSLELRLPIGDVHDIEPVPGSLAALPRFLPRQLPTSAQVVAGYPPWGRWRSATGRRACRRRALDAADPVGLARQAHRVGGSSRLVVAVELAEAARAVERAARGQDWAQLLPACADLHTGAKRVWLFVEAHYLS